MINPAKAEYTIVFSVNNQALYVHVNFLGPVEKLNSTAVSQPAIYVASLAAVEKLRATDAVR